MADSAVPAPLDAVSEQGREIRHTVEEFNYALDSSSSTTASSCGLYASSKKRIDRSPAAHSAGGAISRSRPLLQTSNRGQGSPSS
jgi:hypothetical protein